MDILLALRASYKCPGHMYVWLHHTHVFISLRSYTHVRTCKLRLCYNIMDILLVLRASYKIYMIFWCGSCFCVVNALVWLTLWHIRCFSVVNVLVCLMFWYGQCFAQSNACRRATIHVGPQISTSPVHWRHPNTDRAKILTTPKHRQCWPEGPARYCENDQVCAWPFCSLHGGCSSRQ